MRNWRGFTLLETMLATGVVVAGLVVAASLFSYTFTTNRTNQQRDTAILLLSSKMEEFRDAAVSQAQWQVGGGLNSSLPAPGHFDYISLDANGTAAVSTTDSSLPYLRLWQVSGTDTRMVTVIVFSNRSGSPRRRTELVRATMIASREF
jgi:Tfp pilus assembly protein PilV